jgi:hypothetical protein
MSILAVSVFLSAFLLFALQPLVAKSLLPAFGGTAAVWATCLVVFQTLLLGGYTYAHGLRRLLPPPAQRWVHLGLLALASLLLPPSSHVAAGTGIANPVAELALSLLRSVGLPFFALSATAPLLMEWFRQTGTTKTADRLYAFSNAGSLLALLLYPLALEPLLDLRKQAGWWSAGFALFLLACAGSAWTTRRTLAPAEPKQRTGTAGPRWRWLWLTLPAISSALLLALTNQICQDVAPMPLLWVAPLGVYLLTFIFCFESARWYRRGVFIPLSLTSLLLLAWLLQEGYLHSFAAQLAGYLTVLFAGCMVCHGELYRLRPGAEHLTTYYLGISAGGALGGMFVAIVAPVLFRTLLETPLVACALAGSVTWLLWREGTCLRMSGRPRPVWPAALAGSLVAAAALAWVVRDARQEVIHAERGFYGVYRVKESPRLLLDKERHALKPGPARVLVSGQIYHGLQFTSPDAQRIATTYYGEEGGLGLAFRELPARTNRQVGAVGLGAGTLATYGQQGDRIRFYEISPNVAQLARSHFTFLSNSAAQVDVVLGDGRLSLERELAQGFDLLVLDAFSGDSIPTHLLTDEAMATYLRHLARDGVIAIHVSNSHLDLEPVVRALAEKHGLTALLVPPQQMDTSLGKLPSIWMLLSASQTFLEKPDIALLVNAPFNQAAGARLLWTDAWSSILPILK